MSRRLASLAIALLLYLSATGIASADGIIIPIPRPPRPPEPIQSLAIKYHHVTVTIQDQVATTRVDQVFVNDLPYEIEGDYMFPLPEQAAISRFAMWVDGEKLEAQVLERDEAARIYADIVRERRDPALLEYVGRNAFRARIYPIPARGEKRVEIEYTQVLARDGNLVGYVYPLNTEKFSRRNLDDVQVTVLIDVREGLGAVYSPTHDVTVKRDGLTRATVDYRERNVTPRVDYALYYALNDDTLGINVMSYKERGEDGYMLMLISPRYDTGREPRIARDVHIVLDVSGSMRGEKLAQAKKAVRYILDNLQAQDRFSIVAFSTGTKVYARAPAPATDKDRAIEFVQGLQAGGGTNIEAALTQALQQAAKGRQHVIVFLTDGLPTVGETSTEKIISRVEALASEEVRLFAFGVGYDVNTTLLDEVSQGNHGTSTYVRPNEDIEIAVSSFYEKIAAPVLTDVRLEIKATNVDDMYPDPVPDLFAGGQVVLVSRYARGGKVDVTLTGSVGGRLQRWTFPGVVLQEEGGEEFIPRLWATRKIGYLLTQVRLHGAERELVDEIVALSVRYGIVTPYTSFLVDETEDALSSQGRSAIVDRAYERRQPGAPAAAPLMGLGAGASVAESGKAAVEQSIGQNQLREAQVAAAAPHDTVRTVANKAFVLRDGVWTDTSYDVKQSAEQHVLGSAEYFALLDRYPELGRYLALGDRLIVVWQGRALEIVPRGESLLPSATRAPTKGATPVPRDNIWRRITDWVVTR